MTLVVDASVAVRWCFPLDRSDRAAELLRTQEGLIAPDLIVPELTNAAWKIVSFNDGQADLAREIVRQFERAFDEIVPSAALKDRAFDIALDLRHAAYDCFYLALAEQRRLPFVTADDRLLRRCANTRYAALLRTL